VKQLDLLRPTQAKKRLNMARRKKSSKKKRFSGFKDWTPGERWRKIFSIFIAVFTLYLILACISYINTWQLDQAQVYQFDWGHLFSDDFEMSNITGRLGAIISHQLIYWGFGIASLGLVLIGIKLSLEVWRGVQWISLFRFSFYTLLIVVFFSVSLDFFFNTKSFPWGGAFGEAMSSWFSNFLGDIGLFFLLLSIVIAYFIWLFNPELQPISFSKWSEWLNTSRVSEPKLENKDASNSAEQQVKESNEQAVDSSSDSDEDRHMAVEKEIQNRTKEEEEDSTETDPPSKKEPFEAVPDFDSNSERDNDDDPLEVEISTEGLSTANISSQEEDRDTATDLYDPTAELSHYKNPPLEILEQHDDSNISIDKAELEQKKEQIIKTLYNYKIEITKIRATIGPTVTLYEIVPAPGVRISKIKNLEDDIALSLSALGIRIIAPIPGRGTIGIEVPNKKKQIVSLKEVLESPKFQSAKMELPIAIGKDISNKVFIADLAKMPHLLIAGATGQGKSVGINTILMSLLYKKHPSQLKLVLVDPKKVELFPYSLLDRHFLASLPNTDEAIITDTTQVVNTLASLCIEMDQRYDLLKKAHARNLKEYNNKFVARKLNPQKGHKFLPYIVLVIDEFADLIMTAGKEIELPIGRLAQLARAVGIHLIIATQRPSVNIITGIIKANFPARLAFKVTSKVDSRTILDAGGADQLIGRGDMLFSSDSNLVRLQCAFVDTPEVEKVLKHIQSQQGYSEPYQLPEYDSEATDQPGAISVDELDEMFNDAARLVVHNQHGSTSMIQRKLKLGYNRAGRIMDQLEHFGITGANAGSKAREVLIQSTDELEHILESLEDQKNSTPY
jgi:S-DNA-T family DNA segregation ATPase FtsK/SpoIIIE